MKIKDLSIYVVKTAFFLPQSFAFIGNIVINGSTTVPPIRQKVFEAW